MIYPLYDFKKKDNPENSQVIAISEQARELLHNLNKTLYALSSQYSSLLKPEDLSDSLAKIAAYHKESNNELNNPPVTISTIGTTSSGKSTFINSMLGLKLSPMNSDELSIGVLGFEHNKDFKDSCKLTIDTLVANNLWENGTFVKDFQDTYNMAKDIMEKYRASSEDEELSPPYMNVETAFFAGNNSRFIGLDENAKVNILELPLMIADSESLDFVHNKVKSSLIIFLIDYTVLFNKETKETNHLFEKLIEMKKDVGSKSAILFVLNKIDLRNYDDDSLEKALEKCKKEIKSKLSLHDDIDVIPLNALLMYYAQCAYLGYENGDLRDYNPEVEKEYTESQKTYIDIIKDSLKKCFRDQAKTISEIQDISEENVELIYQIKRVIQKDKIPAYPLFEKFWKECIKRSGGLKLFESIKNKNTEYLKELLLYTPTYKIVNETDKFLNLLEKQIVLDKESDRARLVSDREYIMNLYAEIKDEKDKIRQKIKLLIDDSFVKLRRSDLRFRKDAIKDLDIGQIDESVDNIRKSVEKETIEPIEQAFIDETRSDVLLENLIKRYDWNEAIAKQEVEHYDFVRVKLFNEKRYIDDGRNYEFAENDQYEREKTEEIKKQMEYLCQNLVIAIDQRLGSELQNHIDELAVRVSRWLIRKSREIFEVFEKMLERLKNRVKLDYTEPAIIQSFKFENSFIDKISLHPSISEKKQSIEVDRSGEPNYIKSWKTLWTVKVRDTISKEVDITRFEPVRTQSANWSGSIFKLENDLWEIICDSLYAFFNQALEMYDQVVSQLMYQIGLIFKNENDMLVDAINKNENKWTSIEGIFLEGTSLMKMLHNLTGIPDKYSKPIDVPETKVEIAEEIVVEQVLEISDTDVKTEPSALEIELSQQPGYKYHIENINDDQRLINVETEEKIIVTEVEQTISEISFETDKQIINTDKIHDEIKSSETIAQNIDSVELQTDNSSKSEENK